MRGTSEMTMDHVVDKVVGRRDVVIVDGGLLDNFC